MDTTPSIELIAAVAANGDIGSDNRMLWHVPEDFKHFKATTMGHPVIMGRKTHESIGRPLPGRRNIVVTRNPNYSAEGIEIAHSLEEAYTKCRQAEKIFVIGGADIYAQALEHADVLWLTQLDLSVEGDARFPHFEENAWHRHRLSSLAPNDTRPFAVTFWRLDRVR